VTKVLNEFPQLKKITAIAHQEFLLREDGHHLIVPHQRKIARMMLAVGRGKTTEGFFESPEQVFDLSTDDFIALLNRSQASP